MTDDLIRRSDAIRVLQEVDFCSLAGAELTAIEATKCCKAVEPKRGEWIVYEGEWKDLDYYPPKCKCNQCGYEEDLYILNAKPTNFCPNCGADMREREGE